MHDLQAYCNTTVSSMQSSDNNIGLHTYGDPQKKLIKEKKTNTVVCLYVPL